MWGGGTILACLPNWSTAVDGCIRPPMSVFRQQRALERIEDRLQRTEQLCADLDRENKKLDLEFTDLYDKVRRQMSRMAKRYAVDQKENGKKFEEVSTNDSTDSLDPISRSIMMRRGMAAMTK